MKEVKIKPIELEFTEKELTSKMQTIINELADYNLENKSDLFKTGFNTAIKIVMYNLTNK